MPSFSMPTRLRASFYILSVNIQADSLAVVRYKINPRDFGRNIVVPSAYRRSDSSNFRYPRGVNLVATVIHSVHSQMSALDIGFHSLTVPFLSPPAVIPVIRTTTNSPPNAFPYFAGSRAVLIASPVASYLLQLFLL